MKPRDIRHLTLAAAFLVLLAPAAAPAAGGADDEVTVMEPVFVEAAGTDPWIYFTVPGFEVISHCPDSFNETYARALRLSTAARLAVLPASFWGDLPTPMKIVLYNRKPEKREGFSRGSPIDLSWTAADGGSLGSGIVVHSYPVTVGDGDTFINCGNYWDVRVDSEDFSVDPDSSIRLENRVPRLPSWFVSGMEGQFGLFPSGILRSSAFSTAFMLPSAVWISPAETLDVQKEAKERRKDGKPARPRGMVPLGDLFRGAVPAGKTDLGACEASLLVRWGLYGSGNKEAFLNFVDRASREPVTEDLFRECLGFGYAEAQRRLGEYLLRAVDEPVTVPLEPPREKPLELREAASADVARIIGDWGRLEGRTLSMDNMEYQQECLDQADRLFERVNRRGNSDPLFLAAYGLYEVQVGDDVRAREALTRATRAGVVRPRAYVELARVILDDSLPSVQEGFGDLNDADFTEITGLLTTARVQMPALVATYDLLARVLLHAPRKPDREQIRPLEEGVGLFPQDAALACKLARLMREAGLADEASAVIDRAVKFSDSDQSRAMLAEFPAAKSG